MSHYIAIITSKDYYSGYEHDERDILITSITDWYEVTDDEYKALRAAQSRLGYMILERPTDMKVFVAKTVADYLAYAKAEEKRMAAEKEARENAAIERKIKKELKDKASKLKMFEKLKAELGQEAS
jgi:hypothetical protein